MKFLFFLLFVLLMPLSLASDTQHRFKVAVEIETEDETTRSVFSSYIKRELRSLGDVDVVKQSDKWDYKLVFIALEPTYVNTGRKTGYISIAWAAYQVYHTEIWNHGDVVFYPQLKALFWKTDNLDQICKEIVASFDTKHLESIRDAFQRIKGWNNE